MSYKTLLVCCLFISLGIITSSLQEDRDLFFQYFFKVYRNGTIEKLDNKDQRIPASFDVKAGVQSKDIDINHENDVSARIYLPINVRPGQKLPLLVYYHGGGFATGSAAHKGVHDFVTSVVATANVVAVSVNYRLAPEHCLPAAYDDSWTALKWVASHVKNGEDQDPWLKNFVDFNRVFLSGESAGGNIAHNMAMRVGCEGLGPVKIDGIIPIHPYFLETLLTPSLRSANSLMRDNVTKLWPYVCPTSSGYDDPRVNPVMDPMLWSIGCQKVLVFVAEKDVLVDSGKNYGEALHQRSGKPTEVFETKGRGHVFQLRLTNSKDTWEMIDKMTSFINDN